MTAADQAVTQAALAAFFVWAVEHVKRAPWASAIGDHAPAVSRVISAAFAGLVGIGMTWSWTGNPETGWRGEIFIPPFDALMQFAETFAVQFFGQKGIYKVLYGIPGKPEPPGPPEKPMETSDVR